MSGQRAIKTAEKAVNDEMQEILGTKEDYVIAIDTDSVYINMSQLVNQHTPVNPVNFLDKVCEHFEKKIADAYDTLAVESNAYTNRMVMRTRGDCRPCDLDCEEEIHHAHLGF